MARKKKPGPPDRGPSSTSYAVRMSREYHAWLETLAEHERCGKADVIDRSLAAYAAAVKFKLPPKR